MKYLGKVLLILIIILIGLKLLIHIFDNGHSVKYTVGNFKINENLVVDGIYDKDNYYFTVKGEDFKINFQINENFNKASKIISDVKYFDNKEVKCILPIFKGGKILTDIMCLKDGIINYYHDMDNDEIDNFAKSIKEYDKNNYIDKAKGNKLSNTQTIYKNNFNPDHYLAMESYKGVMLLNNLEDVQLFDDDIYKKPLSIFAGEYYIVADYSEDYSFKTFYIVNLINGNLKEIRSYNEISFDSVFQGYVSGSLYIFDKDAKTQYKIDIDDESVLKTDEIKYYNGKWDTMSLSDALNGKTFSNYKSYNISGYEKVIKIGKDTGYYYYYKKSGNKYKVYRADVQNKKLLTYLFETSDLSSIIYISDYIYFKNGNTFYYYFDKGIRKVVTNTELEFNSDISFGVYFK